MKKNTLRRCAAAVAACAVMASAMPLVPSMTFAAENLISNSTFDSGVADWGTYKESGGACTLTTENGKLALKVSSVGKVNYAVQVFYDIIPLYKNGVYRLKYDISSSVDRYIEAMIQQNGGKYTAYTWKGLELTSEPQTVDYEFTMKYDTDIMSKLVFNCGIQEEHEGELPEHTIYIDNVSLELVDDSNVDYAASRPYEPDISINQVGYVPSASKTAVFRDVTSETEFSVVDADTNEVVLTKPLGEAITNSTAQETNYVGDFSELDVPGRYFIKCGSLDDSYTFEIKDGVYTSLIDDSVRMLYLQRCGVAVEDETFGHVACHNTLATIYGTSQTIDVSGGWHDAGDYGRYIVPAAKAVADLLYAYQTQPEIFSDSIGIPESGNGIPDILDETRFELEWMLKMQADNGGVYHKVSCASFPAYVMPEKETDPLIVMPVSSTATADFAAAMALAYEFYKDVDSEFASKCLSAAEKAWAWLESNGPVLYSNPDDIVTGEYGDKSDTDERYWAAAQLYRATGDSKYLDKLTSASKGLDWATVGDYGNIALVTMDGIDKTSTAYTNAVSAITKQADTFTSRVSDSPYGSSLIKYEWGSNMTIANAGLILSTAYQLTDNDKYEKAAEAQLNYLLGTNPTGYCFVTGYGTVSPEHPHHRPSMNQPTAMKGMLVGGVNQNLEDSAAKAYTRDYANAKRYVDNSESYSTNEITIYWNSPLTYLLALTDAAADEAATPGPQPSGNYLAGDANCDTKVNMGDVVFIMQCNANPGEYQLSAQGKINADVIGNDGVTNGDALAIQQFEAGIVSSLPVDMPDGASQFPSDGSETTTAPAETTFATTTTTTLREETTTTTTTTEAAAETTTQASSSAYPDYGTEMNANATAVADFRLGATPLFFASDGWTNGSCFDCFWYERNTKFEDGALCLTIDQDWSGNYHYSGAEYRTADHYGYGYYETSMMAIKNDGVVSSFFTYTGESENNPWDEIDIEILGKDTTKVQFNYYTNANGGHEFMYDLGFDASQGYHTYGFDWQPDHITWYVDGVAVHTATENIPSTPGRIMMNTWPGVSDPSDENNVIDWLKAYDGKTPLTARYQWVTFNK